MTEAKTQSKACTCKSGCRCNPCTCKTCGC